MKRFGKLGAIAVFSLCLCMILAFAAFAVSLTDIEGHWAKEYIEYGVEKGYINGYEDGTFLPDKTVTRAEFSKMINSAIKLTAVGIAKADFYDVVKTEWYFNEIKKAENAGYIAGYEDGSFRPSNSVTRQEAAVILSRIVLPVNERASVNSFADGSTIDTWATDAVTMIAAKGYIKGDENKNFNPKGALTRSQAAKLICEFVKNENIVNKNQNVTEADGKIIYSESLFTDDVVIDVEGKEDLAVEFKDCRVLGNVYFKNAETAVVLENTKLKALYIDEEDVEVTLDKTSEVKNTYVSYPVSLVGDGFKAVELVGDLSTGFVELDGTFQNVNVKGNAFVTCDLVKKLNVTDKVSLTVMSGIVENLTTESGAKGATINLSKNVVVESATNKEVVSYVGSGTIENAHNDVAGVSYVGVTVENLTGKKDVSESTGSNTSDSFFKDVIFAPEDDDTNVALSSDVTLYFEEEVFDINGDTLDGKYIEETFELRIGGESGVEVSFEAVISPSNKKITVAPKSYLKYDTEYCFVIPANVLTYEDGTVNGEYVMYFETVSVYGDDDDDDDNSSWNSNEVEITFEPGYGEILEADDEIVIKFSERVYKSSSRKELDASYCENQAFEIRKGSTNGSTVKFDAEVNTWYNSVTLKPERILEPGTRYYVIVNSGKLYDYDGDYVYGNYSYFETDDGITVSITPENGATNVPLTPEIVLEFSEPVLNLNERTLTSEDVEDGAVQLTEYYYSNTKVSFTATVSEDARTITIIPSKPLSANTTYYVNVVEGSLIGKNSGEEIEAVSTYFTVASSNSPTITPTSGKKNVSVDTKIEIAFTDKLYKYSYSYYYNREELTNENIQTYIDEANVVTLRRGSADGTIIPCNATLSEDGKTIVLTPKQSLSLNRTYYVVVTGYTLVIGKDSYSTNDSAVSSFSTNETLMPEFKFGNGEDAKKVSITSSLEITFDEDVKNSEGDRLTKRELVNKVISLYKRDNPSEEVDFTASIYNDRVITVTPTKNLEGGTYYVLKVNGGTVKNDAGTQNQMSSIEFKTENVVDRTVTVEPAGYSTDVSIYVNPKITFASPVYKENLKDLTETYVNDYIGLYEGYYAYEDNRVDAKVEFSKDFKTFTIIPTKPLKKGTYYYVYIDSSKFAYDDGYSIYYYSGYFTTTNKDQCPLCYEFHAETDHTCSKCGDKGHENARWCETCESHSHNTDAEHCETCTRYIEECSGHEPGSDDNQQNNENN